MAKHKKKRNKVYSGIDAAITKPIITKIEAKNRSRISQWWFDNKKVIKPIATTAGIVFAIIIIIIGIVQLFTR